ncbi:MAG: pyridoxal-phosphate dependent enzyme [Polyangiaceae bacterium]
MPQAVSSDNHVGSDSAVKEGPERTGVLSLIGNTPLLELTRFDTGPCELFLKLENQNPGGSIKDRLGLSIIEAAEASGELRPGGTIVEATAGNTGLGLALVSAQKGYRLVLVIPDKMSREKVAHLRALGAEVVMTRSDVNKGHPDYYQDKALEIARSRGAFYANQFANPANPNAHERTTGPEIWEQVQHRLDAIVVGVGSGGTATGLARYFARVAPHVELVLADPEGSVLAAKVQGRPLPQPGSWLVEGIGEDFIPPNCEIQRFRTAYTVSDGESLSTARELLRKEGILAGSSSGTLLAAALRYCREQSAPKRVVTFACDSGNKYLSKMFDDSWMASNGCLPQEPTGDLRDLLVRRADRGQVVSLAPDETLHQAHARMRLYDFSQLPVLEGGKVVGILDESDLLSAIRVDANAFAHPVRLHMTDHLVTVAPSTKLTTLLPLLDDGLVALVCDGDEFLGLITRIDVLNWLRRLAA